MAHFEIIITETAQKDFNHIQALVRLKLLKAVNILLSSPFPRGNIIKKLKGVKISLYRLRAGDYRIVYHIDGSQIVIMFVVDRKNFETRLKNFMA